MVNQQEQDSGRRPANQGVRDVIPEPNRINASTPYDFNGRSLTPYGGLLPVITMLEKLGFQALVEQTLTSKRIPRAMDLYRFVLGIVLGLYIGFPRLSQLRFIARDPIRLQSPQRFIDLPGRGVFRPAIEFSHQEHFLPVPVTERKPHAPLAFPIVVIPAVVHEGDAAVDRTADDANPFVRVLRATDVMAAQPDRRDFFVGVSEASIDHSVSLGLARRCYADAR